jgi:hypothetical protein
MKKKKKNKAKEKIRSKGKCIFYTEKLIQDLPEDVISKILLGQTDRFRAELYRLNQILNKIDKNNKQKRNFKKRSKT